MPILKNAKHEAFAQGLADGKPQEVAYVEAGYSSKGARAAASRLCKQNVSIYQRRDELIRQREFDAQEARKQAVAEAKFDRARIIATLEDVVERCMQYTPVLDKEGKAVMIQLGTGELAAAYVFDGKTAVNALVRLGQEQPVPMFVKREDKKPSLLDELSAEVVRAIRARLELASRQHAAQFGRDPVVIDNDQPGLELAGQPAARSATRPPG